MGWSIIVALRPLLAGLPPAGFGWVLAGGLAYSAGALFYLSPRKYSHAVWHAFVMLGSGCHFWAVYRYVLAG
jgi:hemolysin III